VRVLADGGSLSSSLMVQAKQVRSLRLRSQERVVSKHPRRESPAKAAKAQAEARAQAKAARAQAEAEQAQAELAEAKVKVAKEQDAAIARALQEDDEARRQADLTGVAEKEAEAVPDWPPDPPAGRRSG
jgi:hypothetical protein